MENKTICLNCEERCILTPKNKDCLKDARWFDRSQAWCRQCKNEESHSHCIEHVQYTGTWKELSTEFWQDYRIRHPEKKYKTESGKY